MLTMFENVEIGDDNLFIRINEVYSYDQFCSIISGWNGFRYYRGIYESICQVIINGRI